MPSTIVDASLPCLIKPEELCPNVWVPPPPKSAATRVPESKRSDVCRRTAGTKG